MLAAVNPDSLVSLAAGEALAVRRAEDCAAELGATSALLANPATQELVRRFLERKH